MEAGELVLVIVVVVRRCQMIIAEMGDSGIGVWYGGRERVGGEEDKRRSMRV